MASRLKPLTVDGVTSGNFGLALLFAALCFIGFESSAIYREEAKDPEKTVPRATYLSVILIGTFYVISAWALLTALGNSGIASASQGNVTTIFSDVAGQLLGPVVPDLINVLVVTSTFACLLSLHNSVARYAYSLGKDGVLPSKLGIAHKRHHSPYLASIFTSALEILAVVCIALATGLEAAGDAAFTIYIRANGLGATTIVFLMCLVSVAVLVYFRRESAGLQLNLWRSLVAPGAGLIGLATVLVLGLANIDALIGAGPTVSSLLAMLLPLVFILAFGYANWLKSRKPSVYARIGRQ